MTTKKDESAELLGQVVSILAKIEKVWEQRLVAETTTKDVPTKVLVSRQFKIGPDAKWSDPLDTETEMNVTRFITAPAMVGCELGSTVNMGNYESARVAISITVPCYREEVEAAYLWAQKFAEERFKAEVEEARTYAASLKRGDSF